MKRALLTGATGFMGSMLVESLLSRGVEVVHLAPTDELAVKHGDRARGICCDLADLEPVSNELAGDEAFDVVYHLAWDGVSTDCKNDFDRQMKNIGYGLSVCKLAHDLGCKHVVVPGSVSECAYSPVPVDGTQPPSPGDAYAAAKAMTRIACDLFARQNGIDLTWLLVSSVYGPTRADANIITYAISSLLDGERPSFTSLTQQWDYLYVDDLVEALWLAGERGKGAVYAVGSGEARPLRAYIEAIRDAIDPTAELGIGEVPHKTSACDNSVVDISSFARDTGFAARVPFEKGIAATIAAAREKRANAGKE